MQTLYDFEIQYCQKIRENKMKKEQCTYNPNPVDTSEIELSSELLQLVEYMAENVYDVWAKTRIERSNKNRRCCW